MSDDDLRRDAAVIRGGSARLARRLRSERPDDALTSNKISLLSHLARHGADSPARIAVAEHHQHEQLIEAAVVELAAEGLIEVAEGATGAPADRVLTITSAGHGALERDGRQRDEWLVGVLHELEPGDVDLLRRASRLMTRISDRPGRYRHLPHGRPVSG